MCLRAFTHSCLYACWMVLGSMEWREGGENRMTFGSPGKKQRALFSWWFLHVDLLGRHPGNELVIS